MSEIQGPLRLARGSHGGTAYACAMNVISWEQGDQFITDFPTCTARPLATLVQCVNDNACEHPIHEDGRTLLCAPCAMDVLDLAHRTVGTSRFDPAGTWLWLRELLVGRNGIIEDVNDVKVASVVRRAAAACVEPIPFGIVPRGRQALFHAGPHSLAHSFAKSVIRYKQDAASPDVVTELAGPMAWSFVKIKASVPGEMVVAGHFAIDAWERVHGPGTMPDAKRIAAAVKHYSRVPA